MTTGEKLVQLSQLSTGTAMEHLLAITTGGGGGGNAPSIYFLDIVNTSGVGIPDGEITIMASGGTMPFEYSLGGSYQVNNTFTGLLDGEYTISVRDFSGYTDTIGGILLSAPSADSPIISELIVTEASNKTSGDGSIRIVAAGGLAPYQYSINGGGYQNNNVFINLGVGSYTLRVKDANDVVFQLSGVNVGAKVSGVVGGGGMGLTRATNKSRYRTKVQVTNVKLSEEKPVEKNKITVKVII